MASKKNNTFLLGAKPETLIVTGGPNDWDMWLCLRGTKSEVSFYTERPVQFPGFSDCATFFAGRIETLEKERWMPDEMWYVEGVTRKGSVSIDFKGKYDVSTRRGEFRFL